MPAPDPARELRSDPPPTLTRRQRQERTHRALMNAAHSRSPGRRQALLDYVVRLNLGLAHDVAIRYLEHGRDNDAVLQVSHRALARAAETFEPGRDENFLAYAAGEIQREIAEHGARAWAVPGAAGWTPGT